MDRTRLMDRVDLPVLDLYCRRGLLQPFQTEATSRRSRIRTTGPGWTNSACPQPMSTRPSGAFTRVFVRNRELLMARTL